MVAIGKVGFRVLGALRRDWRALLAFHLLFAVVAATVLVPLSGWLLAFVLGAFSVPVHTLVSFDDYLRFAASPGGALWALTSGSLTLLLVFIEHAGMMQVASHSGARYRAAAAALWRIGTRLRQLTGLAVLQVGAHLLLSAPFAAAIAVAYDGLLGAYDPYYVSRARPTEWWVFIGLCVPVIAFMLAANAWLYLRWVLALPCVMFERLNPVAALRRSAALTGGHRLKLATLLLLLLAVLALMPAALAWLNRILANSLLNGLPEQSGIIAAAALLYLTAYLLLVFAVSFLGIGANSLLIYKSYLWTADKPLPARRAAASKRVWWLAWSAELALVLLALGQAGYVLNSFDFEDEVAITAHRGSSLKAPENSLRAVELAVADGADYVEVDVRLTADGEVVLLHDRDLRRTLGVHRRIRDITLQELRRLEATTDTVEPIPTLDDALDAVRGRAGLYVEIKALARDPELVSAVIGRLRQRAEVDTTVVASTLPAVVRDVAEMEPRLKTTLFARYVIGGHYRSVIDALGLHHSQISPPAVSAARRHGYELHTWTVNDPDTMSRLIDAGVDNIITDRPDVLAQLLAERRDMPRAQLLLIKIRNWLRDR